MALTKCAECGKEISEKALMCPNCGCAASGSGRLLAYEYRSKTEILGLPLVHIVYGLPIHPVTGRFRVAKGIVAIGNIATGGLAIGGVSLGIVGFGGVAVGLVAVGGLAVGLLALGGMAIGLVAVGGGAVGYYALGGGAWGKHALGANARDPNAVQFFKQYLGPWVEKMHQQPHQ